MNKPKLILSTTSPYARKVRMIALENKIDFDIAVDVPWNEDTGVIILNPLGKVPVWVTESKENIFDSRVIVEFLEIQNGNKLSSTDPMKYLKIKKIESLAEGVMDASLCLFAERKKRPKELQHQWWIDRQFGKVHRGLSQLQDLLANNDYFFENRLTVADFAVVSAIGYIQLRFSDDFKWDMMYPELARFYDRMMKRPSCIETVPVL